MNLSYISFVFILSSILACSKANFVGEVSKQKNSAETPPVAGDMPGEDAVGQTPDDGSGDDGGNTDSDNVDGGTDSGNVDGGNTDSGNVDGGNTDSGNTDSGNTDSGNTDSGNVDGGNTDAGNTDGGNTDSGNTDSGNTDSGNTDGGNVDGGNTDGGNTDGGNTDSGNTDSGNTDSGNTDSGNTDGGNTDGGNADGNDPHECKDPKEEIIDICQRYELLSLEQELFYPERMDCSFKPRHHHRHHHHRTDTFNGLTEGNLHRKDRYLQAREWQTQQVELPANAVICGMEIVSKQDQIQYDDFLIFTIDDRILMLSNNELLRKMPKKDGVYHWDFDAIKGRKYGFDGDRYCLGNDSSCVFPGHDRQGAVNFSVGTSAIAAVSASLQGQTTYNFSAIATGDNDDEDCWHTDLELDVKIRYVLKPE